MPTTLDSSRPGRHRLFMGLAALSAVTALVLAGCSDDSDDSGGTSPGASAPATAGPDRTTPAASLPGDSATELVLPESDFPSLTGGKFSLKTAASETSEEDSKVEIDNPECEAFVNADDPTADHATRELEQEQSSGNTLRNVSYDAKVIKEIAPSYTDDFESIINACHDLTMRIPNGDTTIEAKVTMERIAVAGVDGKYNGVSIKGTFTASNINFVLETRMLLGTERGTSFRTGYDFLGTEGQTGETDVDENLAEMFNDQRERIADAD